MRKCFNCAKQLPPETEHFDYGGNPYCTECVDVEEYIAEQYFIEGEYIGDSEGNGDVEFIESYDDEYEGE